jgi:hypothetical protein
VNEVVTLLPHRVSGWWLIKRDEAVKRHVAQLGVMAWFTSTLS